jgi:hypothetical protein
LLTSICCSIAVVASITNTVTIVVFLLCICKQRTIILWKIMHTIIFLWINNAKNQWWWRIVSSDNQTHWSLPGFKALSAVSRFYCKKGF